MLMRTNLIQLKLGKLHLLLSVGSYGWGSRTANLGLWEWNPLLAGSLAIVSCFLHSNTIQLSLTLTPHLFNLFYFLLVENILAGFLGSLPKEDRQLPEGGPQSGKLFDLKSNFQLGKGEHPEQYTSGT